MDYELMNAPSIIESVKKISQSYFNKLLKKEKIDTLTSTHLMYFMILYNDGGMTQAELSKIVEKDKAHTNRVVGVLCKQGLFEQKQVENKVLIELTARGKETAVKLEKAFDVWYQQVTDGITKEELIKVQLTVDKMYQNALKFSKSLED